MFLLTRLLTMSVPPPKLMVCYMTLNNTSMRSWSKGHRDHLAPRVLPDTAGCLVPTQMSQIWWNTSKVKKQLLDKLKCLAHQEGDYCDNSWICPLTDHGAIVGAPGRPGQKGDKGFPGPKGEKGTLKPGEQFKLKPESGKPCKPIFVPGDINI